MLTSMEPIGTTLTNKSLQEIFEHPIGMTYTIVLTTKTNHNNNPRIRRCAEKCGKGVDT